MLLTNVMQKILVNTPFMQQLVADFFHTQAGKALFNSQKQIKIEAPETNVVGEQRLFIHSAEKAIVNSQGIIEMRGEQGANEFNQAFSYQKAVEEKAVLAIIVFGTLEIHNTSFGFFFHSFLIGERLIKLACPLFTSHLNHTLRVNNGFLYTMYE